MATRGSTNMDTWMTGNPQGGVGGQGSSFNHPLPLAEAPTQPLAQATAEVSEDVETNPLPPPCPAPNRSVGSVRSVCVVPGRAHAGLVGKHCPVDPLGGLHHAPVADGAHARPASAGL